MAGEQSADPAQFVRVAGLYRRTSRRGRVLYFGRWSKTRLYLFPNLERRPKDAQPVVGLCVRLADYDAKTAP